jgi:hypothetical protein
METERQRKFFWDVRIVISFKQNRTKLHILVFEASKEQAETKAIEWGKKYVHDNYKAISKCIGYDAVMIEQPRAHALKTSYCVVM